MKKRINVRNIFSDYSFGILILLGTIIALSSNLMSKRQTLERVQTAILAERMRLPDTVHVVTLSGSTTYFTYRDEEMGYQYELLRLFSQESGIPYTIRTAPDMETIHRMLAHGEAQLSITPEAVTQEGKRTLRYTGPESESSMVLVQRLREGKNDSIHINNVTQLLGQKVHILAGTNAQRRLQSLGEQLGGTIDMVLIQGDTINTEDLIAQVSHREIDYTIVDLDLARLARTYYPNIDINLPISFTQRLRWITTDQYEGLAQHIDAWAKRTPQLAEAQSIYRRYFEMTKTPLHKVAIKIATGQKMNINGGLSPYDDLFEKHATRLEGWSWHLLAAIAWQESNFQADIIGWSGARGLMGIMPRTGEAFGASKEELLDPNTSIRVSVDCLLATEGYFSKVSDPIERLKLTLAGYNAGIGHIQDAQRLAEKYGADPNVWEDNVRRFVLLKSERKYYTDPVCKAGYLRGKETSEYVGQVFALYEAYKRSKP